MRSAKASSASYHQKKLTVSTCVDAAPVHLGDPLRAEDHQGLDGPGQRRARDHRLDLLEGTVPVDVDHPGRPPPDPHHLARRRRRPGLGGHG